MTAPVRITGVESGPKNEAVFTLSIAIEVAASGTVDPAPPEEVEIVATWKTRHFADPPEPLAHGSHVALPRFGVAGVRFRVAAGPGAAAIQTLAIPGLRQLEPGKKRRIRAFVLDRGIPVQVVSHERKAKKKKMKNVLERATPDGE